MPTDDPDCPFCMISAGEAPARIVFRDEQSVAFFPLQPATLGHTLLIPISHVPDIWSLPAATASHLAETSVKLASAIRQSLAPDGLNIIQSNGTVATQTVMHLHVHLVPRWTDDAMGEIWPAEVTYNEIVKDAAWQRLALACSAVFGTSAISAEQHVLPVISDRALPPEPS